MNSLLKNVSKHAVRIPFRLFGGIIPAPIRDVLLEHHRSTQRQIALPYWERKEKRGQAKTPVRVGFVGAGRYAQFHLQALSSFNGVEVPAILTTGGPKAQEAAAKYNIVKTFKDIDAFIAQDNLDCFVVVVSAQYLKSVALKCLSTGKPVLMEKPPGVSSAEATELVQQAERHNTFGMVGMNRRFFSQVEHGLAALASCGPIRGAMLELPEAITPQRQSKRLTEWDFDHYYVRNSIHGIDLLRYIMGDPVKVHSVTWMNEEFQNAAASYASILEYERGKVATVTSLWDTIDTWRLKVVAEQGWIEFEPLAATVKAWLYNKRGKTPIRMDPIDQEFRAGVYAQDLYFVEAVRRGKKPLPLPACSLQDAHKTMLLMEQIQSNNLANSVR
jgi:predicted dehydrogenase